MTFPHAGQQLIFATLAAAILLTWCGCRPTSSNEQRLNGDPIAAAWFTSSGELLGVTAVNNPGPAGSYFMPQSMGNGAALFDFNGDGRLDILLLQGAPPHAAVTNVLYQQQSDGTFRDVSRGSGLDVAGFGSGVAIGDVNNDDRPDVLITEYGRLRMFQNLGDGKFRDVSQECGIASLLWGTSASFFDYDRDGKLDLVIANYVDYDAGKLCFARDGTPDFCGPNQFAGSPPLLFHNVTQFAGAEPRFNNVTAAAGMAKALAPGLGVLCADFNGDAWDDVLIANDQAPNQLWINQHDGTFRDEAIERGVAVNSLGKAEANMGVAWGDVSGDGLNDLLITHLDFETHTLWKQSPRGLFGDATASAGLATLRRTTGFGVALQDFDLDGDLDIAIANGRIVRGPVDAAAKNVPTFWQPYAQSNELLENHEGAFRSIAVANSALCGEANVARALCYGDLDNDGDLDLLVVRTAQSPLVLINNAVSNDSSKNGSSICCHWLLLRAYDPALHRDAYGAVVTVVAGDQRWERLINPATGYLSSNDHRAHFGLGTALRVDKISVRWPDGLLEHFTIDAVDRLVQLNRGAGVTADAAR